MKISVVKTPQNKRYIFLRQGIGVFYAEKGGGAVLRHETSWRKICGIWVNTPRGCWWIQVRNHGR